MKRRSKKGIKKYQGMTAFARLLSLAVAVTVVVGGVTFAALQSQQVKITGNSIETATANLQVSPDGNQYSPLLSGFVFSNIVPGGRAMPLNGYSFFLKNSGGVPLELKFSVSSSPNNPNNIDLSKVNVTLNPSGGGSPQVYPLSALIAANTTGGMTVLTPNQLMPGASAQYSLQVSMATDALTGNSGSLGNVDFAFSGLAQSN